MSFLKKISDAVLSWRRRRVEQPSRRRANVAMEQLDHRQLLAVNFTGNVLTDFPATTNPGVVVLPDNPAVVHPQFPTNQLLQQQILVSGFDISRGRETTFTPGMSAVSSSAIRNASNRPPLDRAP